MTSPIATVHPPSAASSRSPGAPPLARPAVSGRVLPPARIVAVGTYLALSVGLVLHALHGGQQEAHAIPPLLHWLRDSGLAAPAAILTLWLVERVLGLAPTGHGAIRTLGWALAGALVYVLVLIPGNAAHEWLFVDEDAHSHAFSFLHALRDASAALGPAFLLLLAAAGVGRMRWIRRVAKSLRDAFRSGFGVLSAPGFAGASASILLIATGFLGMRPGSGSTSAMAAETCGPGSALRQYDVVAISLDIPFNRWGDHNPNGMIYALEGDRAAVQNWHLPLNANPDLDPAGNRRLRPRPLVLRANEGECVEVTLRNDLNPTPGEGLHQNPRASIHVHGVSYDVQTSDGSRVGFNADTTVGIGESTTYYWLAPTQEGLYFFHDHAGLAGSEADGGSNAHGLYGALVVEPAGSTWLDPVSGDELYTGTTTQSGELYINAIIVPPAAQAGLYDGTVGAANAVLRARNSVAFRESVQVSQDEIPVEHRQGIPALADEGGLGFNYGFEPLLDRQEPINRCPDCVGEETWLSSWPYGDPALVKLASGPGPWLPEWHPTTADRGGLEDCGLPGGCFTSNVTHAYVFDPAKVRFAHAGPKETHVFHMHAHQWLADPFTVGNSGYTPGQPDDQHMPGAVTIDSQTFGPGEAFTADLLFGAGSKPGTVGDSIFHCHLYPHFAEGFWSLYRVHDRLEDGTAETPDGVGVRAVVPMPDRSDPPPSRTEFSPGYPRFIPGDYGWRAPQARDGVSEQNGLAADVSGTVAREDLRPALRVVAGDALDQALLEAAQTVTLAGADAGTFTLGFATAAYGAETTAPLPFNAGPAAVATAIEALDGVEAVLVTGTPGAWEVTLRLWSSADSMLLTAANVDLSGPGPVVLGVSTDPDFDLGDASVARRAYQLAIERHVSLNQYNPGYDPGGDLAVLNQPKPGAPFVDPCPGGAREITYNVSIIQTRLVYNEGGWFDPQGRILVLDRDVEAVLAGEKQPEPFYFRANSGDCINYNLTNRLPNFLGGDDFLELVQTNMVGQHIHLVKFDVIASDGATNGWNYTEAAFSHAQAQFNQDVLTGTQTCAPDTFDGITPLAGGCRVVATAADDDPLASSAGLPPGQTYHERWFADYQLRTVFSHDHHFPAEDQNRGYFAALVVEPAGTDTRDPFNGEFFQPLSDPAHGPLCGGTDPAAPGACEAFAVGTQRDIIGPLPNDDFREYGLAVQDFVNLYRPCSVCEPSVITGSEPLNPPDEPEAYPDDDPGVFGINYRNAPFQLRNSVGGVPVDPAYTFSSTVFGDPATPLLQAYAGDPIRVRVIQGANEEQHVVQLHGMRWRDHPDDPKSPLVNARSIGISEAFNFEVPRMECGVDSDCRGDYLYSGTSTDDLWLGVWGILRVFGKGVQGLLPLPDNVPPASGGTVNLTPTGSPPPPANQPGQPCPSSATVRAYHVIAVDTGIVYNEFGDHDPYGLVYAAVQPGETAAEAAARVRSTNPEPMVIRANAGECVEVTLTNMIDPSGAFATMHAPFGAHESDPRGGDPPLVLEPPTGTQAGLRVSLHPAIVIYDVRGSDGATIGYNRDQTVGPGEEILYRWYADTRADGEHGAINLVDYGDVRGHRHHGLFAGLVIEPPGATYHDPVTGSQVLSAQQADIRVPGQPDFREFVTFFQDGLNLRDSVTNEPLPDSFDHPPTPEEPVGELPDAEDRGEKGFNYRNASFHGRLGVAAGEPLDELGGSDLAHVFSSELHADPTTPIFRAYVGDQVRIRVLQGGDKPRQHSFQVSGHAWQRNPHEAMANTALLGSDGGFSVGRALNLHLAAGGPIGQPGDFRYNCGVLFHHQSGGLWGIMRVYDQPVDAAIVPPDALQPLDSPHVAGYHPILPLELVQLTVTAYDDHDMDGSRGTEEGVLEGIEVELFEAAGADGPAAGALPIGTALTDLSGNAYFNVRPGGYDVKAVTPALWTATEPDWVRLDATSQLELPVGLLGLAELLPGTIDVHVFRDADGDGLMDAGESPLSGWAVDLTAMDVATGAGSWSASTDADGIAGFGGLYKGTYSVSVTPPPGWNETRAVPFQVTLPNGGSETPLLGYALPAGLTVRLFNDSNQNGSRDAGESVLPGWNVMAVGGPVGEGLSPVAHEAITDVNGVASFGEIDPGPYTVTQALPADWSFATASASVTDLLVGTTDPTPADFTCTAASCSTELQSETSQQIVVGNRNPNVWVVAEPFGDVSNDGIRQGAEKKLVGWNAVLQRGGATVAGPVLTGSDGRATFYVDPGAAAGGEPPFGFTALVWQPDDTDATVPWRPTPATFATDAAVAATPGAKSVSVIAGETVVAQLGFISLGTIEVQVFHDQDRDGVYDDSFESSLANRTARLYDRRGKEVLQQKATDSSGRVAFQVAAGTEYQVEVALPGGWVASFPLAPNGKPTNLVKVMSDPDPLRSVALDFGQYQSDDSTPPPAPVADPPGATGLAELPPVTLTSEAGATIRYTLDGSDPTPGSGAVYDAAIFIGVDATLKAIAIDAAGNVSGVTMEVYEFLAPGPGPGPITTADAINVAPGGWSADRGTLTIGGDSVTLEAARRGRSYVVSATGSAAPVSGVGGLTSLEVTYDASASRAVTRNLSLYNVAAGSWEQFDSGFEVTGASQVVWTAPGDVNRFVSAAGELRIRLEATDPAPFSITVRQVRFGYEYAAP